MREAHFIAKLNELVKKVNDLTGWVRNVEINVQTLHIAQSARSMALEKLLISKGLITEVEVKAACEAEAEIIMAKQEKGTEAVPCGQKQEGEVEPCATLPS